MKRSALIFLVLFVFGFITFSWGQCPEPNDRGECDTMYVEPWPADTLLEGDGPWLVRVPIYLTSDLNDVDDSISGFTLPFCYTRSNPSMYCSVSGYWNKVSTLYLAPDFGRSVFRHIVTGTDTVHNRMADLDQDFSYRAWDSMQLDLDGTSHFWLAMIPLGTPDQRWWEGSRVLVATMTFRVQDSMQICIDTCFWPPSNRLSCWIEPEGGGLAIKKVPRLGSPHETSYEVCFNLRKPADVREIQGSEDSRPSEFLLSQNYPNPFNPTTNFEFSLSLSAHVKIDIFNIVGQKVRTLVDEEMKPGVYVADWDGKDENGKSVSSGIYFYRMEAGEFSDMKKMVLVK